MAGQYKFLTERELRRVHVVGMALFQKIHDCSFKDAFSGLCLFSQPCETCENDLELVGVLEKLISNEGAMKKDI